MSSTNKTTNYELSQFIGTDKPAWLGDYNSDMAKIDAQMKVNANGVASASGTATSASTNIGDLTNLTTTSKTNLVSAVNEVKSSADTAQGTATTANTTATTAQASANENRLLINAILDQFNMTTTKFDNSTPNGRSITGASFGDGSYTVSRNSDSTLFKVYADATLANCVANQEIRINLPVSGFTVPDNTPYSITPSGLAIFGDGSVIKETQAVYCSVENGRIIVRFTPHLSGTVLLEVYPCLYINKSFGDIPQGS